MCKVYPSWCSSLAYLLVLTITATLLFVKCLKQPHDATLRNLVLKTHRLATYKSTVSGRTTPRDVILLYRSPYIDRRRLFWPSACDSFIKIYKLKVHNDCMRVAIAVC
jgi:hypothetical protein